MIVLFTDFGPGGPYLGQVRLVLARTAPNEQVIELISDAPAHNPKACAYLLPAYAGELDPGTVLLCVVDPGVGGARSPLVVEADGRWFVGPDNGLFAMVLRRAKRSRAWRIVWAPDRLSPLFHGRDLFAPIAGRLARLISGADDPDAMDMPAGLMTSTIATRYDDWPDDLPEVVYIDHFGNAVTGLRASKIPAGVSIIALGHNLEQVRTFSDAPLGALIWYENSSGLVEIAANRARADQRLGAKVGTPVTVRMP